MIYVALTWGGDAAGQLGHGSIREGIALARLALGGSPGGGASAMQRRRRRSGSRRGLTLAHFSSQPEPFSEGSLEAFWRFFVIFLY